MTLPSFIRGTLVCTSVVLAGCKPCEDHPPATPPPPDPHADALQIVAGEFLDAATVALAFSRPLAPVDGVDPSKFRLSVAWGQRYDLRAQCRASTYYCEPALGLTDFACASCYASSYVADDACPPPLAVTSLARDPDDATQLRLGLSMPIDPLLCLQLEYTAGDAFLQVHFSRLDMPTITDQDDEALADISPRWVLEDTTETLHDGLFPLRDALVPIPCPEDFG